MEVSHPSHLTVPRFSLSRLFLFGLPALPGAALLFPLSAYLPPYYSAATGLGLGTIGLIFMVMRFWDIAIDPVIGILSDRTKSRFGRRRPWIAASVPVLALGVWALFFPPDGVGAVWLALSLMVAFVGFTLLTISHYAWAADLSEDPHERSRLQGAIVIVGLVGTLVAMLLPALVEGSATDPMKARVESMGAAALLLLPFCVGLALWATPDPVRPIQSSTTSSWRSVLSALSNRPFRWIIAADFVQGIAGGMLLSTFIFFSASFLGLAERAGLLLLLFFVSGVVFVPLWLIVARRFGKTRTTSLASLATIPAIALYLVIPKGDLAWAAFVQILFGSTLGVWIFLTRSIVADLVDGDSSAGDRPTGVYFALTTLTTKLGQAIAVGIGYIALERLGVDPISGVGDSSLVAAITLLPPTLGHVFMIFAMHRVDVLQISATA